MLLLWFFCTLLDEVIYFERINKKRTTEVKKPQQQHGFIFKKKDLYVIGVDVFSKQWGVFFASDHDFP